VRPLWLAGLAVLFINTSQAADLDRQPIEAATVNGERVHLFPNGRWVYVDAIKAEEAKLRAAEYPENKTRPVEAQGGLFGGFGRLIMPGDKDYNRGSLNPKAR
jgi:hypothetical protein